MISTIPTTFSNTKPSFLQLSEGRQYIRRKIRIRNEELQHYFQSVFRQLTDDDGVYFALNLQGGVVAAEDVDHLFQLGLLDRQVMFLLKVLLQQQERTDYTNNQ